jgi:Flp pilus assembly protein TadG
MRGVDDVEQGRERQAPGRLRVMARDQRGFVRGFVLRTLFIFVILIVGVEEVGQIVLAQTRASNAAGTAAQAAADDYHLSKDARHAETIALAVMASQDPKATMTAFSLGKDGAITVTASEPAATYFVQHLPFVKKYWVQSATVTQIHTLA